MLQRAYRFGWKNCWFSWWDRWSLTIIVLNKWDEKYEYIPKNGRKVKKKEVLDFYLCPNRAVSAKTGRSIDRLKEKIVEIFENYTQRIPTSQLTK